MLQCAREIKVSGSLRDELYAQMVQGFSRVFPRGFDISQVVDNYLSYEKAVANILGFQDLTGTSLKGRDLLEVGSGMGMNLVAAEKEFGANVTGIEPGNAEFNGFFRLSSQILRSYGCERASVITAQGENLPFEDGKFDAVVSFNVLEHTLCPAKVISESLRVLKKGGWLYFSFPSYGSFWEGHYKMLWFPFLTPALAKIYVKVFGRDSSYIDQLHFLTPRKVMKMLAPFKDIQIVTTGRSLWRRKMMTLEGLRWVHSGFFKSLLRICRLLRLNSVLIALDRVFDFYTPIVLVLKKNG